MKCMALEEFYSTLKSNEYGKQYLRFIEKIQSENRGTCKEAGYELHHIHPRKLGGDLQDPANLVKISLFEHCQAHVLLAKAIPCKETLATIFMMSSNQYKNLSDLEKITLEEIYRWAEVRSSAQEVIADNNRRRLLDEEYVKRWKATKQDHVCVTKGGKDRCISRTKLEDFLKKGWELGRTYRPPKEVGMKISEKKRGRIWINNGECDKLVNIESLQDYLLGGWQRGRSLVQRERLKQMNQAKAKDPGFIERLSAGCKKAHENPEYNAKISRALTGYRKSEEHLEKIRANNRRKAQDPEFRQKISNTLSGNICITKDGKNRHIRPEQLPLYEREGWRKGMDKRPRVLRLEIYGEV